MTPTVGRFWSWVALISVLLAGIVFGWALRGWDNPRVSSVRLSPGHHAYAIRGGELWHIYSGGDHSRVAEKVTWLE